MPALRWETTTAKDFRALVELIPGATLDSPQRSVLPLLDFFRQPMEALERLGGALSLELMEATELAFEYGVPVQKGQGRASSTDLMIQCPGVSVAIEAKYTEPRYELVAEWLGQSSNRAEVLSGWLSLISEACQEEIGSETVSGIPYQLIHRTASACSMPTSERALAYVVFGDGPKDEYVRDVAALDSLLGRPRGLSMYVLGVPAAGTETQERLAERWDSGERQLAADVRVALLRGPLFTFGPITLGYQRP